MKRSVSSIILTMAWAIATPSQAVLADKLHLQASFAVAFAATPNSPPVAYCGGPALDFKVEAHGNGYSSFGALAFFVAQTYYWMHTVKGWGSGLAGAVCVFAVTTWPRLVRDRKRSNLWRAVLCRSGGTGPSLGRGAR